MVLERHFQLSRAALRLVWVNLRTMNWGGRGVDHF